MEDVGIERINDCMVATCSGEITFEATPKVKRALEPHMARKDIRALVLDLRQVVYLDSSGISMLIAVNTRMQSVGTPFYLYRPSEQVRKTLDMVQLIGFFKLLDTEEDLDRLTGPPTAKTRTTRT